MADSQSAEFTIQVTAPQESSTEAQGASAQGQQPEITLSPPALGLEISVTPADSNFELGTKTVYAAAHVPFTKLSEDEERRVKELENLIAASTFTATDADQGSVLYDEAGNIKAATLDKLVEKLIFNSVKDPKFHETFFLIYQSFTTSHILFGKLLKAFSANKSNETVLQRILDMLQYWAKNHFGHFDNAMVVCLVKFLEDEVSQSPLAGQVEAFNALISKLRSAQIRSGELKKAFNLEDWAPAEIAQQMTLIEFDLFRKILPHECFGNAWTKPNRLAAAPNISAMIDRVNKVARWVSTTIMQERTAERRGMLIERFIEIAVELRALNNFNGLYEIVAGLSNSSVYRLKDSWKLIDPEAKKTFEYFEHLLSPPYGQLLLELSETKPPCIPMIGKYLYDLTYVEDSNRDTVTTPRRSPVPKRNIHEVDNNDNNKNNGSSSSSSNADQKDVLINYEKSTRFASILQDIYKFQQIPYLASAREGLPVNKVMNVTISHIDNKEGGQAQAQVQVQPEGDELARLIENNGNGVEAENAEVVIEELIPYLQSALTRDIFVGLWDEDKLYETSLSYETRTRRASSFRRSSSQLGLPVQGDLFRG